MFENNKLNLLISIVAAICIWIYVTLMINPEVDAQIKNIPVELINLESIRDRGLTVSGAENFTVDVTVLGPRSEVSELTAADFKATADMTGYPKGVVNVKVRVVGPSDATLSQVNPETVSVEVVDLITVTKPVRVEYSEVFAKGTEPGFVTVMPDEMEVSGTAEYVDSIDYIRAQVPAGALSEQMTTLSLDPVPISKTGLPVDMDEVELSQDVVQMSATLCTVKSVLLNFDMIGEVPENVQVTGMSVPRNIMVRGTKEAVDGLTEVFAKDIDLSKLTETVEIAIEPYLPEGVEVSDKAGERAVKIEIQGISKRSFRFTADMIEVANLRTGLFGHVNTGEVVVTLLAPEDIIDNIRQDDIRVYVDASDIMNPADAIELEVAFACDKEFKSLAASPDTVRVTITGKNGLSSSG